MGFISSSGNRVSTPKEEIDRTPTDRLIPKEEIVFTDKDVSDMPHVRDIWETQTSINADRYDETVAALQLFVRGATIKVTYYHQNLPGNRRQGDISQLESDTHNVHKDTTKILGFELKLQSGIEADLQSDDTNRALIQGEAVTYPGFIPYVHDRFSMDLSDGRFGDCEVTSIVPLSHRKSKSYKLNFYVRQFTTSPVLEELEPTVRETYVFDKLVNLDRGTFSLYKRDDYLIQQKFIELKRVYTNHYFRNFYNPDALSIIPPDEVYDPYVVDFLNRILSCQETKSKPLQLFTRSRNFDNTVWSLLYHQLPVGLLPETRCSVEKKFHQANNYHYDHNWLLNKYYKDVSTFDTQKDPYVFSYAFYHRNTGQMSVYERLVYSVLEDRKIPSMSALLSEIDTYFSQASEIQFYTYPTYVYLMTLAIHQLPYTGR